MSIDGIRRALRDTYRCDLIRDGIELLQCLEERGNPIDKSNRIICAAEGGRRAWDDNGHLRDSFPCGFPGCICGRDV